MLIDWFTVVAQILNFLILIVLLKRFLYDRIIRAMDEREERIQVRMEEARKNSKEAEEEAESYREKQKQWESRRSEMMEKAREEAEEEGKALVQKAREETEELRVRWKESLQKEKKAFFRKMARMTAEQVYGISRRALRDLADRDMEQQMVASFLSSIRELPSEEKRRMGDAVRDNGNGATILSGFELSTDSKSKIAGVVHEELSKGSEIAYEINPDLIMGVEIKGHGEKAAWSVKTYLEELEAGTRKILEREAAGA